MKKYQHILVAINIYEDFSQVLQQAELLAEKNQARLTILTVVSDPTDFMPMSQQYHGSLEASTLEQLEKEVETLTLKNVTAVVKAGKPHQVITDYAREKSIDLIVVGSHGRHGLNLLLGSVSNGILHRASCDVLTVRVSENKPAQAYSYKKALLATDLKDDNQSIVEAAKALQKPFDFKLDAISVGLDPAQIIGTYGVVPTAGDHYMQDEQKTFDQWVADNQIKGKATFTCGNAATEINQYANNNGHDLIVMGSHKRGALGRFFLGSTANAVLHYAQQDVLVVKLNND